MIRRPPRSTQSRSSAASDVYKRGLCLRRLSLLVLVTLVLLPPGGSVSQSTLASPVQRAHAHVVGSLEPFVSPVVAAASCHCQHYCGSKQKHCHARDRDQSDEYPVALPRWPVRWWILRRRLLFRRRHLARCRFVGFLFGLIIARNRRVHI